MKNKIKIKRNDEVFVIRGKDKGARGKVLRVFPVARTAIVERVNMMKRHTRPNPQKNVQGGVLEKEAPIQLSVSPTRALWLAERLRAAAEEAAYQNN